VSTIGDRDLRQPLEQAEAVETRHLQVEDHQIHVSRVEALEGRRPVGRLEGRVTFELERAGERGPDVLLVVHDQDRRHAQARSPGARSIGRWIVIVAPRAGAPSAAIVPPCSVTMRWTIAIPRPVPPFSDRVVK
jgi:hypothetical protein